MDNPGEKKDNSEDGGSEDNSPEKDRRVSTPRKRRKSTRDPKEGSSDSDTVSNTEPLELASASASLVDPGPGYSSSDTSDLEAPSPGPYRIRGLVWGTGAANSCTVDQFLTSLKLAFMRTKYNFVLNFRHTSGPGLEMENELRKMCDQLSITDEEYHGEDETRLRAIQNSRILHVGWVKVITGSYPVSKPDLIGDSSSKVFEHVFCSSLFSYQYSCKCKGKIYPTKTISSVFFRNHEQVILFVNLHLIPDKDIKAETTGGTCRTCVEFYDCTLTFPETTWLFIMQFSFKFTRDETPLQLRFDSGVFRNAFATYVRSSAPALTASLTFDPDETINLSDEDTELPVTLPHPQPTSQGQVVYVAHQTSRLYHKGSMFTYDDMREGGALIPVMNRWPTPDPQVRLDSVVMFRVPPLREPAAPVAPTPTPGPSKPFQILSKPDTHQK